MRYIEWLVLFILGACGTGLANLIGYGVSFTDSIPGLLVLIVISMIAVFLTKVLPLKLPIVAYCSIIGLISACPLSPVREFVIQAAGNINFTAPFHHGGRICRAGHQRPAEDVSQPGMENPDCRYFRDDRDIFGLLSVGSDDSDPHRGYLIEEEIRECRK